MAALTDNKDLLFYSNLRRKNVKAQAGTYYAGQLVYSYEGGNAAPLLSGSTVAGLDILGVCLDETVVANNGDDLLIHEGSASDESFFMSGSGFTGKEYNQFVFVEDSDTAYATQGSNRLIAGRVKSFVTASGTEGVLIRGLGTIVSQSV